jgi:hypothetical protein
VPVEFSYNPRMAVLVKRFLGVVTDGDFLLDACVTSEDPRAGRFVLVDLTDVKRADVSARGMRQVIALDKGGTGRPRPERVAVVAPTTVLYALVRTYEGLAKAAGAPTRFRVFKGLDDAQAWIEGTASPSQPTDGSDASTPSEGEGRPGDGDE